MNERQAADQFGFTGQLVPGVRFATSTVTAVAQPNLSEIARRNVVGLGPVLNARLLEALAALPLGWPVAWMELDRVTRAVLQEAPPGIVEWSADQAVRRWCPAVTLNGVLRTTSEWRTGMRLVSAFAPDAPRGLLVTRPPQRLSELLEEAELLGIGVMVLDDTDQGQLVAAPLKEPCVDPGPRHWRLLETVFAVWQRAGTASSTQSRHAGRAGGQQALPCCGP